MCLLTEDCRFLTIIISESMNRLLTAFLLAVAAFAVSCSNVSEDERLIYVAPPMVSKAVLIEDFTGQRCINCPDAADEIEKMQEEYGKENVIAVSVHSGPLAVYSNTRITGLRTQLGDDYYDHWNIEAQPAGLINRKGGVMALDKWRAAVHRELQEQTILTLALSAEADTLQHKAEVSVSAIAGERFVGKLQLWIVEDSIVAPQMMPDGTMNMSYVHHGVLRAAVNGEWGTDVDWDGEQAAAFTFDLDAGWNTDRLSVVAFVYDDNGVKQVTATRLVKNK